MPGRDPRPTGTPLTSALHLLRSSLPLLVVGALLGLLVGVLAPGLAPQRYTASADVQVLGGAIGPGTPVVRSATGLNIDTEREVATSSDVEQRVREEAGREAVVGDIAVTQVGRADVLRFSYTVVDAPQSARDGANAWAGAYLTVRGAQIQASVDAATRALTARLAALEAAETAPSVAGQRVAALRTQLAALEAVIVQPGQAIGTADLPASPTGLPRRILAVSGLALGLLAALTLAVVRGAVRPRVNAGNVGAGLELPLLGRLPSAGTSGRKDERAWSTTPVRLAAALQGRGARTVALVTAGPSAPAGIADGLRRALSDAGSEVALVETASGSVSEARAGSGLAEDSSAGHVTDVQGSGASAVPILAEAGASALVADRARLVQPGAVDADVVLLTSIDVRHDLDALRRASAADAAVLVTRTGEALEEVRDAADLVTSAGGRLVGVLLVEGRIWA